MLSKLSIVYPKLDSLDAAWYSEFNNCFSDESVERIELNVAPGDFQISRSAAINLATREFVTSPDPDDTFDLAVYSEGVRYLLTYPNIAAVTFLEEWYDERGGTITPMRAEPITAGDVFKTPVSMHSATIFRTALLKEAVAKLNMFRFRRYDWALRIYIAGNYPIHRIPKVGYRYRIHDAGIRKLVLDVDGWIESRDTYAVINAAQLLSRPWKSG